jgi:hypothetical protein
MTQQYFHRYLIVGVRMQTALTCLIYKKVIISLTYANLFIQICFLIKNIF